MDYLAGKLVLRCRKLPQIPYAICFLQDFRQDTLLHTILLAEAHGVSWVRADRSEPIGTPARLEATGIRWDSRLPFDALHTSLAEQATGRCAFFGRV